MTYSGLSRDTKETLSRLRIRGLVTKNVKIDGRRTSVRLEPSMWKALDEIAEDEGCSIHEICTAVYEIKMDDTSFTAALRVFIMLYYKSKPVFVPTDQAV